MIDSTGVIVAALSVIAVLITALFARMSGLERRINLLDSENDLLWWWARKLVDYYYRFRRPDSPPPPPPPRGIRGSSGPEDKGEE